MARHLVVPSHDPSTEGSPAGDDLVAFGPAVVVVVPGFILLYVLDQRRLLPEEGLAEVGDRPPEASAE